MTKDKPILLTWHSVGHGEEVLWNALDLLNKQQQIEIKTIYYLLQQKEHNKIPEKKEHEIEIIRIKLDIKGPTDHNSIYQEMKRNVVPKLKSIKNLHINLSPGTPAMHAIWLLLHSGGAFPVGTKMWSTQWIEERKQTELYPVQFEINTYLAEIKKWCRSNPKTAIYEIEGLSKLRNQALQKVARFSRVPQAPLLITGERGTGKTRLVEIHVKKIKNKKEVITLPCGTLDDNLGESILFGHEKGAFTGATTKREGLLKKANEGILFLDEIQDLSKHLQRKLVRPLQDKEHSFRPVGSDQEEKSDFELVCGSNLPIHQLKKTLDSDFFDRICHLIVEIPH